jgi:hypothetical protein
MGQRELILKAKHREEERLFKIAQAQNLYVVKIAQLGLEYTHRCATAAGRCNPNASRGHRRSSPANYLHLELLDLYRLLAVEFVAAIGEVRSLGYSVAAASASVSRRRACSDDTLMLRRAATARGESCRFKASKVARTML